MDQLKPDEKIIAIAKEAIRCWEGTPLYPTERTLAEYVLRLVEAAKEGKGKQKKLVG